MKYQLTFNDFIYISSSSSLSISFGSSVGPIVSGDSESKYLSSSSWVFKSILSYVSLSSTVLEKNKIYAYVNNERLFH